jgi:hypothetical protein
MQLEDTLALTPALCPSIREDAKARRPGEGELSAVCMPIHGLAKFGSNADTVESMHRNAVRSIYAQATTPLVLRSPRLHEI